MATFSGAIRHLRNGTFLSRIRWALEVKRRQTICRQWLSKKKFGKRLIAEIAPDVFLDVYMGDELSRLIYCRGFEFSERCFVRTFLKPGDIFVDVGANIGLYTILASNLVGSTGRVIAFEPTDLAFRRLQNNVLAHAKENVELHRCALSSERSKLDLNQSDRGRDAWNSVSKIESNGIYERALLVDAFTLDDVVKDRDLVGQLSLVKIDVEGWETNVLRGSYQTLTRDDAPVLMVEFTDYAAQSADSTCQELYREIESFGYKLYDYDSAKNRLFHSPIRDSYPYQNLFAVKDQRKTVRRLEGLG